MAITNAQQYKQLVNPPLDGKRPGYRGDAAARSTGAAQSGRADPGPRGDPGEGRDSRGREAPSAGPRGDDAPTGRYDEVSSQAIERARKFKASQDAQRDSGNFLSNILNPTARRKAMFNASLMIPGSKQRITNMRKAYAKYLTDMGVTPSDELLDTENLYDFFDSQAFEKNLKPADANIEAPMNYGDFALEYFGSPGVKFSGDVGNKEVYVKGYREDGSKIYDVREKTGDGGGGDGGMSDYERRLLELENQLKNQQAAAAAPTTGGPIAYRFFADGGSTGGIMDADIVGGMMDGNMDEMGRQMYGLGKLVKKATRGIKKIAKSPLGKVALLAGGAGLLSKAGFGLPSFLSKKGLSDFFFAGKDMALKNLTQKGLFTGLAGISALPLLFGQEEEEDYDPYRGPDIDIANIRSDPYAAMGQAYRFAADGGLMRQNYDEAGAVMSKEDMEKMAKSPLYKGFKTMYGVSPDMARDNKEYEGKFKQFEQLFKKGYQEGGDVEPVAKKTMPLIDMDGKEKDYRETGGFVDMGRMERADDVPARLSKNEFVFTADAVRNAGDGDIDKGAEVMYNMMKNLEAGGEVSEESQGLEGARNMFQTSQRLGEVI